MDQYNRDKNGKFAPKGTGDQTGGSKETPNQRVFRQATDKINKENMADKQKTIDMIKSLEGKKANDPEEWTEYHEGKLNQYKAALNNHLNGGFDKGFAKGIGQKTYEDHYGELMSAAGEVKTAEDLGYVDELAKEFLDFVEADVGATFDESNEEEARKYSPEFGYLGDVYTEAANALNDIDDKWEASQKAEFYYGLQQKANSPRRPKSQRTDGLPF